MTAHCRLASSPLRSFNQTLASRIGIVVGSALKWDAWKWLTPVLFWLSGKFVNLKEKFLERRDFQVLQDGEVLFSSFKKH